MNKLNLSILIFTITYTIIAGIYFLSVGNLEFLWYVGILASLIILMIVLHKKFKFSSIVLFGASLWGFLHMLGGGLRINGERLYGKMIISIYNSDVPGMQILKYDQFMHFYTYVVVVVLLFYILNTYLKEKVNWLIISVLLVFMAVGVGAINEIVEFMPVVFLENTGVGGYHNTLLDIIFNMLGSIAGVIYLSFKKKNA